MRFLHLADLHLDTAFMGRSRELREELRRASRAAVDEAVGIAVDRDLDAVLIAGDLFDGQRLSLGTERFLTERLRRLGEAGITVIYATGNHDPGGGALHREGIDWPGNVTLLDRPEPRRLPVLRDGQTVGHVTGAGHPSHRVTDDLSRRFPRPEGGGPEVALLHAQVVGSRGDADHEPYAPAELSFLRSAGYDYWALGHIHVRQALSRDPPVHYPGNVQGRTPRERGAKGGLVVDLSRRGHPRIEFVELAPVRWERMTVSGLEEISRPRDVVRRIEEAWHRFREEEAPESSARWILRVELEGPSPLHRELRSEELVEDLRGVLLPSLGLVHLEILTGALRPPRKVEEHAARTDVLGEALRLLRRLSDPEGPSPDRVLGIAHGDLAGGPGEGGPALAAYLRDLLREREAELLDALLEAEGE